MFENEPTSEKGHVKTKIVKLGKVDLYEPYVFKGGKDGSGRNASGEEEKKENKPYFRVNLAYDKIEDADQIECDQRAVEYVMDAEGWSAKTKSQANIVLRDADEDEVSETPGSKKMILLAEKRPQLAGKYSLALKSRVRPVVFYADPETRTKVRLPEPILNPDPSNPDEMEESERIKELWDKWVYEGQYAQVSYTYKAYVTATNKGVNDELMNVFIVGGGQRRGRVPFEADFDDDDIENAFRFLDELKKRGQSDDVDDDAEDDDVDEDTGEVTARRRRTSKASRSRRIKEEDEAPKSKRRKPAPVETDMDDNDDEFDDDDLF